MATDTLSSLMILVCVVALIILLAFMVYTWYKWHAKEVQQAAAPTHPEGTAPGIEVTSYTPHHHPQAHFQHGYLNEVGKDSPNLSGSRTFLNEDVLKQKPFHKATSAPASFESKDVVYHADAERDPNELRSGDIVFHANGPFGENKTTNGLQVGHVVYNNEGTNGKRRWTESMVPGGEQDESEASHRKNTYL